MPSRHFREWYAYYQMEPFGQWRDNWHSAVIACILANVNRAPNKQPSTPAEFMYEDPYEARLRRDREMMVWLDSKAKN